MSAKNEPMFQMLLVTLKDESEATKGMFFAGKESDLVRAYQEGKDAYLNKVPVSKNPYPAKPDDYGKYTMNMCWNEGFVDTLISTEQ